MNYKKRTFEIIENTKLSDFAGRIFGIFILALILLNILAVIIGSFNGLPGFLVHFLLIFETASVIVFTIEYALRVWTSSYKYPESIHPRIKYLFSASAMIDLFAILPFYVPFLFAFDLRFIRMLRLLRLTRIFKLNKYSKSLRIIGRVFKKEKESLLATSFISILLILFSSSVMYFIENEAQPDKFPNIIASTWWAVATLTTVGYGDIYPITLLGKVLSGIISVLGIGLVALPTAIISSGFIGQINARKNVDHENCPHCGKPINHDE